MDQNLALCFSSQVWYEYYVVATRPKPSNGYGLTPDRAIRELMHIQELGQYLDDSIQVRDNWLKLVERYQVSGKPAHDARLVAVMQTHGLQQLYTLNPKDFQRYAGVVELV